MPRTGFNHWKVTLPLVFCFFLSFFLGLNYWQLFLPNYCFPSSSSSSSSSSISIDYQSFYNHFQYRTNSSCTNERKNIFLVIAVLSSYERLIDYLPSIFETWILTTTIEIEIIFFLEEHSFNTDEFLDKLFFKLNEKNIHSCLFMVKLKHVQNEYPPQKKSFYAMKFLHAFYHNRTAWILRLDDNAYVNIPSLIRWLKSIDHREIHYIGQGGTGRPTGPAIYFPQGKSFCMGGCGVILSQAALHQLGPWLDQCYQFELLTKHEDVELGRCILIYLNISCTNAYDSKFYFYHHYGPRYMFGYDFTPSILSRAMIIHPINDRNTFRQIFYFYQRMQHQKIQSIQWKTINQINYVTFANTMEFDLIRDIHYQFIDVRWKAYIDLTVRSYLDHLQRLWHQRANNWTIINRKFLFGYHRIIPRYGLELFIEILFNIRSISIYPPQTRLARKRLHFRQTFLEKTYIDYREIDQLDSIEDNNRLNLIVVSYNKDQTLRRFIRNFHLEILNHSQRREQFTLTILYFHHQNSSFVNHLNQLNVRYPSIIRVIITKNEYNRGYGRQLASKYFTNNQLLFFLDVDILFTGQSLINTRRLIIHQLSTASCVVYFPIIYSTFSNISTRENRSNLINVKNHAGLFSIYGFGNVATRKADLERIGGWQIHNYDWGDEDGDLFTKFVNISTECVIFRAVEPGFRHCYHRKMCDGIIDQNRQKMCFNAEANLLGSPIDMIEYLSKNQILTKHEDNNTK